MFPDSNIAQKMTCGPTKLAYLICFGIAPYFRELLLADLKEAPCFAVIFDESLNQELQKEQMDFVVRYLKNGLVRSRYLISHFLGHTTAADLKEGFENATGKLQQQKLVQISMDGPNVNWKMYDNITEERRRSEEYPGLIDVGCCSLHTVHGAFRTGVKKTNWNLEVLLRALHSYFSESPAKREDYIQVTGSNKFPFTFCGHGGHSDWRQTSCRGSIGHLASHNFLCCGNPQETQQQDSNISLIHDNEISCAGQVDCCQATVLCINSKHHEVLPPDVSDWCSTSALHQCRTSKNATSPDGKVCEEGSSWSCRHWTKTGKAGCGQYRQ